MALTPYPRRRTATDLTLIESLTENPTSGTTDVTVPAATNAKMPPVAQLIAQAIVGPPPTLLQKQFQSQIGQALFQLASAGGALAAAAGSLSPLNALNAFQQLGVNATDPTVVGGLALTGARPSAERLMVHQLAAAQENAGLLLTRNAPMRIAVRQHQVLIRSKGRTYRVPIHVQADDTNEVALTEAAQALNSTAPDVAAGLTYPTPSTIQLALASREPGRSGTFDVQDGEGSFVALTRIDTVVQQAQDARYTLNGVETRAPSNVILLQGGRVQLNLLRAAEGVTQVIVVGADEQAVGQAMGTLVAALQAMAKVIADGKQSLASGFVDEFAAVLQGLGPLAGAVGITIGSENEVRLDEQTLLSALRADPDRVHNAIAGPNGLAHRLGQFASDVMSSPISRFGAPNLIPPVRPAGGRPSPAKLLASQTLNSLLYAQLLSQGLFVDSDT